MSVKRLAWLPISAAVFLSLGVSASHGSTLSLRGGNFFFGPGRTGAHPIPNAQVRNLTLTGPLTGEIPFFNNGPDAPNVIAEILLGGEVDGRTSNGMLINENIDTGLFLELADPDSGEAVRLMAVAIAAEQLRPDAKGNLTFNPSIIADPGIPEFAVPFSVVFTTGAKRIPLSLRTQAGEPGGHDQAGPIPSGRFLIGRLGDFNQDGFLDGVLVQAENTPRDLFVARGDPIGQYRPWSLDVPIPPLAAAAATLNGIVQNFPEPLLTAIAARDAAALRQYLADLRERLEAIRRNLARAVPSRDHESQQHSRQQRAAAKVAKAQRLVQRPTTPHRINQALQLLGEALQLIALPGSVAEGNQGPALETP